MIPISGTGFRKRSCSTISRSGMTIRRKVIPSSPSGPGHRRPGRLAPPYPPRAAAEGVREVGAFAAPSGRDNVPDVVAVVAFEVAGVLVILPVIERLGLVRPLLCARITHHPSPVSRILGVARHLQ